MTTQPRGLTSAVNEFNHACRTYETALEAFRSSRIQDYESNLRSACAELGRALEHLFKVHLEDRAPAPVRKELRRSKFGELLEFMVQYARPQLLSSTAHELQKYRMDLRNPTEHEGTIPASQDLFEVLTMARGVFETYVPAGTELPAVVAAPEAGVRDFDRELADYLQSVKLQSRYVDLAGISPRVGGQTVKVALDELYVPLEFTEAPSHAASPLPTMNRQGEPNAEAMARGLVEGEKTPSAESQLTVPDSVLPPVRKSLAEVMKSTHIVILGAPGSGKTTLARFIAFHVASRSDLDLPERVRSAIPLVVKAGDYADAMQLTPGLSLQSYVGNPQRSHFAHLMAAAVLNGSLLVILDGLDEIADPALRGRCVRRIDEFISECPTIQVLVTSRLVGYQRAQLSPDFGQFEVAEFTDDQIQKFLENWHVAVHAETGAEDDGTARAEWVSQLWESIQSTPGVRMLASCPLLLTVIALVSFRGVRLPTRRTDLYSIASHTLLEDWPQRHRGVVEHAEDFLALLQPIAYRMVASSHPDKIHERELRPLFEQAIVEMNGCSAEAAHREATSLLKTIQEQTGFFYVHGFDESGASLYGFLHLTFVEYLAALHLANLWDAGEVSIGDYLHRPRWREVLLLMAGHVAATLPAAGGRLLGAIQSSGSRFEDYLHRDLFFCADILSDGVRVSRERQDVVVSRLVDLCLSSGHGEASLRAATVLKQVATRQQLGAPMSALDVALDDPTDVVIRKTALLLYIGLRRDTTVPQLLDALMKGEDIEPLANAALRGEGTSPEDVTFLVLEQGTGATSSEEGTPSSGTVTAMTIPVELAAEIRRAGFVCCSAPELLDPEAPTTGVARLWLVRPAELLAGGWDRLVAQVLSLDEVRRAVAMLTLAWPGRPPGLVAALVGLGNGGGAEADRSAVLNALWQVRNIEEGYGNVSREHFFDGCYKEALLLAESTKGTAGAVHLWVMLYMGMDEALKEDERLTLPFDDIEHSACDLRLQLDVWMRRGSEEAMSFARRARRSSSPAVRVTAACALSVAGVVSDEEIPGVAEEVVEELLRRRQDVKAPHPFGLAGLVGLWRNARRLESRKAVLGSIEAVLANAQEGDSAGLGSLGEKHRSPDHRNAEAAALVERSLRSQSAETRTAAAYIWPFLRVPEGPVTPMLRLLEDDAPSVRAAALTGLVGVPSMPQDALAQVVDLLSDSDESVRKKATDLLLKVNEPETREWLAGEVATLLAGDRDNPAALGVLQELVENS